MSKLSAMAQEALFDITLPASPYPGLRPFEPSEWPIFFGRERMADEVITRLLRNGFVVVHGDSGSGKSSLIYAGVLPALAQQVARGGLRWLTCYATPGDDPIGNLARALAQLEGGEADDNRVFELKRAIRFGADGAAALTGPPKHDVPHEAEPDADSETPPPLLDLGPEAANHICILVDQFEELFAHARRHGPEDARAFIEFLNGVKDRSGRNLYAILTMRSEFLGACAQFRGFAEAVNQTQYLLPRMERADLLRAIQQPAKLYGGEVQRQLAERLIDDASSTQDPLPLIQHGVMWLYHRRKSAGGGGERWALTLEQYTAAGKNLAGILSDEADGVEGIVFLKQRRTCPRLVEDVFRALTDINADGQAVRRPQKLRELIAVTAASEEDVRYVVDSFRANSFLRPYGKRPLSLDDRVDISHEALIRCWTKLARLEDGWLIKEFRNGLVWRSLLVQADSFERKRENLLSAATTEERVTWLNRRNAAWSERYGGGWGRVTRLIDASVAAVEREKEHTALMEQERLRHETAEQARKLEDQERQREESEQLLREKAARALAEQEARRARTFRNGLYVAAVLTAIAIGLGIVSLNQKNRAELERRAAVVAAAEAQKARADADARATQLSDYEAQAKALQVQVTRLIAEVPANSSVRAQLTNVQKELTQQAQSATEAAKLAPRIYMQISSESQRDMARELATRIGQIKIGSDPVFVPGIDLRPSVKNVLRCFRREDCASDAPALVDSINKLLGSPKLTLEKFLQYGESRSIRARHYEIWIAPGEITFANETALASAQ